MSILMASPLPALHFNANMCHQTLRKPIQFQDDWCLRWPARRTLLPADPTPAVEAKFFPKDGQFLKFRPQPKPSFFLSETDCFNMSGHEAHEVSRTSDLSTTKSAASQSDLTAETNRTLLASPKKNKKTSRQSLHLASRSFSTIDPSNAITRSLWSQAKSREISYIRLWAISFFFAGPLSGRPFWIYQPTLSNSEKLKHLNT